MANVWASTKHVVELENRNTQDDNLLREAPDILKTTKLYNGLDRLGSGTAIAYRKWFGTNIASDLPVQQMAAADGVTSAAVGVVIDDAYPVAASAIMPGDYSFDGMSELNPIQEPDRAKIGNKVVQMCMYEQGQDAIDRLKAVVGDIVDTSLTQVENHARPAPEFYAEMLNETAAGVQIEQVVRRALFSVAISDVMDQLLGDPDVARYDRHTLSSAVFDIAYQKTVVDLDKPGGLVELVAYQTIEPSVFNAVSTMDVEKEIEEGIDRQRQLQTIMESAQARRKDVSPMDEEYEMASKEYIQAKKALDKDPKSLD